MDLAAESGSPLPSWNRGTLKGHTSRRATARRCARVYGGGLGVAASPVGSATLSSSWLIAGKGTADQTNLSGLQVVLCRVLRRRSRRGLALESCGLYVDAGATPAQHDALARHLSRSAEALTLRIFAVAIGDVYAHFGRRGSALEHATNREVIDVGAILSGSPRSAQLSPRLRGGELQDSWARPSGQELIASTLRRVDFDAPLRRGRERSVRFRHGFPLQLRPLEGGTDQVSRSANRYLVADPAGGRSTRGQRPPDAPWPGIVGN